MDSSTSQPLYEGRFLTLAQRGAWEYVTRVRATGVVAIVAITDDNRIVLVEQYRPAVQARVIELPAGLVGDLDRSESHLTAAQRELEEETGYQAADWRPLPAVCSSPGMTDETIQLFLARGLTKTGAGGGVEDEAITVHAVELHDLERWLTGYLGPGKMVHVKVYAGAYLALAHLK